MRRKFALLLTFLCLLLGSVGNAYAYVQDSNETTGYSLVINDEAGYFSADEAASLEDLMEELTQYCNVYLLTTESHSYSSTNSLAQGTLENEFGTKNGVIFVIDRCLDEIFLYSNGKAYKTITKSRAYSITDNTYIYATSSHDYDYYTCSYKTFEQVLVLLEGGRIAQPMKYICSVLLAIIFGLLINYFVAMWTSRSKKANVKQILSGTYSKVYVHEPNKRFLTKTKRYSPQSSGGGGGRSGGGGGRSGGGGHSGGGGGHRI